MRNFFLILVFILVSIIAKSQNPIGLEYQTSFESINLNNYDDLLLRNSSFLLTKNRELYKFGYGLEIQESLLGEFGGLYVFGISTDLDLKLDDNSHIYLNFNGFLGGGGGASAPDGSGLCYRYSYGFKKVINSKSNISLRYSNLNFPNGEISGSQFQLGFTYLIDSIFNNNLRKSNSLKQLISFQTILMNIDEIDAHRLDDNYLSRLIGAQYQVSINEQVNILLRFQAAVSKNIDGFMSYYSGLSYNFFDFNKFSLKFNGLIGSCGGGSMQSEGGLSYQLEGSLEYSINKLNLSLSSGYNDSYNAPFNAHYFQIGLGRSIDNRNQFDNNVLLKDSSISRFIICSGIEFRNAPDKKDYNNNQYTEMGLILFGFAYPYRSTNIIIETRWAMLGNYGAYAEASFGLSNNIIDSRKFTLIIPLQIVIAGGGGIDVGSGFGLQSNLILKYKISKQLSVFNSIGKIDMYKGNYDPFIFNFGISQNIDY